MGQGNSQQIYQSITTDKKEIKEQSFLDVMEQNAIEAQERIASDITNFLNTELNEVSLADDVDICVKALIKYMVSSSDKGKRNINGDVKSPLFFKTWEKLNINFKGEKSNFDSRMGNHIIKIKEEFAQRTGLKIEDSQTLHLRVCYFRIINHYTFNVYINF